MTIAAVQSAEKARLRAELTAARRARSAEDISAARSAIRTAVLAEQATRSWRCVAAYVPLSSEPGSRELLDDLAAAGVRVLVPVLLPDLDLDWAEWDVAAGAPGAALGRDAVAGADAVLVPALAVARDGTRLGRGGGSYDRVLPRVPRGVPIAALLYPGEVLARLPREDWDSRVTAVVTPSGWTDLDGPAQT